MEAPRACVSSEHLHRLHPSTSLPHPPSLTHSTASASLSRSRHKKRSLRNLFAATFSKGPGRAGKSRSVEKLSGLWVDGRHPADPADSYLRVDKDGSSLQIVDVCNNVAELSLEGSSDAGSSVMAGSVEMNGNGPPVEMTSSCHPDLGSGGKAWARDVPASPAHRRLAHWKASMRRRFSLSSNSESPQHEALPPPPPAPAQPASEISRVLPRSRPASAHFHSQHGILRPLPQGPGRPGGPFPRTQSPAHGPLVPLTSRHGRAKYTRIEKLGEGSYATVFKSRNVLTGGIVALKEIKLQEEEGVPFTAIREASLLKGLRHANIVLLHEIIHERTALTLVFEFMEMDLSKFLEHYPDGLLPYNAKLLLFQLLRGLAFVHARRILHRDLKPQNLLLNRDGELKLADFGLARAASVPSRTFSHEVVTLWYRPPDVLLGNTSYSTDLDLWGVGCIFAELLTGRALFPGTKDVADQLDKIFALLGRPSERDWPALAHFPHYEPSKLGPVGPGRPLSSVSWKLGGEWSASCGLLRSLLRLRPRERVSAAAALAHPFFADLPPQAHRLPPFSSLFMLPSVALRTEPRDRLRDRRHHFV